jgi:hypothetical protein
MPFVKGQKKIEGSGLKKGQSLNKTVALTEMIDGALNKLGGMDWLVEQGRENPTAFMSLVGKRLPKDLTIGGNINQPLVIEIVKYGGGESTDYGTDL